MKNYIKMKGQSVPVIVVVMAFIFVIFLLAIFFRDKRPEARSVGMLKQDSATEAVVSMPDSPKTQLAPKAMPYTPAPNPPVKVAKDGAI